jgi:hypothetical protein
LRCLAKSEYPLISNRVFSSIKILRTIDGNRVKNPALKRGALEKI